MTINETKYTIESKNYYVKTPEKLKLAADIALALIPIVTSAELTAPEFPGKQWVFWGLITVLSLFKLVSKFVADSNDPGYGPAQ
jgi:hypothetical protein